MKAKITFVIIVFSIAKVFSQSALYRNTQDPLFINAQQSLVYLNPSFAGSNGLLRTQSLYRFPLGVQSYSSATLYNAVDVYVKPLKGGIAFTYLLNDYGAGKLNTNTFALSYARYFSMMSGHLKIIPSLQIAYFEKKLDKTKVTFGELIQPGRIQWPYEVGSNKSNMDFSSGLLVNYYGSYFGLTVFHLSQPNEGLLGDSRLPARFSIHSSVNRRSFSGRTNINFFVQYQRQGRYDYANLKITWISRYIIFGVGYFFNAGNHGGSLNLGYKNNYFTVGLGYDQYLKNFSDRVNGCLEAQFSLNIRDKEQRKIKNDYFEAW